MCSTRAGPGLTAKGKRDPWITADVILAPLSAGVSVSDEK